MADNTTYQSGTLATLPSGLIVATDEIAGTLEHAQVVKMAVSADGDRTIIPADAANGLDVDVTRAPGTVADAGALPSVLYVVGGFDGANVQALAVNASGQLQVGGPLTDAQLRATPVPVEQATSVDVADGGSSLTVDAVDLDIRNLAPATDQVEVIGDVAHDAVAAGNPVLVAGFAETPDDSAPGNQVSAEADAARIAVDRDGAVYTHPHPPRIWHVAAEHTAQQTDTTIKAAPGAGLSLYITDILLTCNAAVTVSIEESTTTLKFRYYASGQGDGAAVNFSTPMKITANTLISVTTSAAVTVFLDVHGFTGP